MFLSLYLCVVLVLSVDSWQLSGYFGGPYINSYDDIAAICCEAKCREGEECVVRRIDMWLKEPKQIPLERILPYSECLDLTSQQTTSNVSNSTLN